MRELFAEGLLAAALVWGVAATATAVHAAARARAGSKAMREALERQAALVAAASRIGGAARESTEAVRCEIARAARDVAPGTDTALLYEQTDEELLRCVAAFGKRVAYFEGTLVDPGDAEALPARALAARHRVILARGERPIHPNDAAALAVPVGAGSELGCILAVTSRHAIAAEAIEGLVILAGLASPAYLIAIDRERDRWRAEFDGLTGLLTPRAFRDRLAAIVQHARHDASARLGLVFVDTDHFKSWNDRHGHAFGDALLREVARVLRSACGSPEDLIARNGGDEFCLVLTETDKATAIERAHALCDRIRAIADIGAPSGPVHVSVTASIGIAAFPADARTASDLLELADAAMYHTKNTGRDGVSFRDSDGSFTRFGASRVLRRPETKNAPMMSSCRTPL